jgi:acyl-CoA thioesterase-1
LERLDRHLKRRIDIFILELGINDAFHARPIEEIRANLQEIVDRVKRANSKVRIIICGMQLPNYTADDYVSSFGTMYGELAARNNAAIVPYLLEGVGGDPSLNFPDRIHPNVAGHKVLAENVWRVLEPIALEVSKSGSFAGKIQKTP